jgi:hypothetical protein
VQRRPETALGKDDRVDAMGQLAQLGVAQPTRRARDAASFS